MNLAQALLLIVSGYFFTAAIYCFMRYREEMQKHE